MNAVEQAQQAILRQVRKPRRTRKRWSPEEELTYQLDICNVDYVRQFKFCSDRRYRADFRIGNILIEINGGIWIGGRHTRGGKSYEDECRRLNAGTIAGYRWLWFVPDQVYSGEAVTVIEAAVGGGK